MYMENDRSVHTFSSVQAPQPSVTVPHAACGLADPVVPSRTVSFGHTPASVNGEGDEGMDQAEGKETELSQEIAHNLHIFDWLGLVRSFSPVHAVRTCRTTVLAVSWTCPVPLSVC